jgi:hypothetical protein
MLYSNAPTDAVTYCLVAVVLISVAAVASFVACAAALEGRPAGGVARWVSAPAIRSPQAPPRSEQSDLR